MRARHFGSDDLQLQAKSRSATRHRGQHPYVYLDGIVLKRSWAGEVAIGVNSKGYREILGICEGAKEDKAGWSSFLKHLKVCAAIDSALEENLSGRSDAIYRTAYLSVSSNGIFTSLGLRPLDAGTDQRNLSAQV